MGKMVLVDLPMEVMIVEGLCSTRYPACKDKLRLMDGKVMVCDRCGFKAGEDETPPTWYIRNAQELRVTSDEGLGKEAMWVSGMRGTEQNEEKH